MHQSDSCFIALSGDLKEQILSIFELSFFEGERLTEMEDGDVFYKVHVFVTLWVLC